MVYSIVETAKASGVDIYNYLKFLLLNSPGPKATAEELEKLCPWDPKCRAELEEMQRKDQESILNA